MLPTCFPSTPHPTPLHIYIYMQCHLSNAVWFVDKIHSQYLTLALARQRDMGKEKKKCVWEGGGGGGREDISLSFTVALRSRGINVTKANDRARNGQPRTSSSNWILMSCQPHRVTSGQSNSGHKQIHISKLFSHIYQPSVKSIYKTNHFTDIKVRTVLVWTWRHQRFF